MYSFVIYFCFHLKNSLSASIDVAIILGLKFLENYKIERTMKNDVVGNQKLNYASKLQ